MFTFELFEFSMVVDISVLITEGIMIRGRLRLKYFFLNVIYFSPGPYFKWVIKNINNYRYRPI